MYVPGLDIFISYARRDRGRAEKLSIALKKRRWNVWWDRELKVNAPFDRIIQEKLKRARCIIALWSHHSVTSKWVKKEALVGWKKNRLVQVLLEDVIPPKRFRKLHAADLVNWNGKFSSKKYKEFVSFLEGYIGKPGNAYYVPLDTIDVKMKTSGRRIRGKHLCDCLNKAPSDRRYWFLRDNGIVKRENGSYLVKVREFYDKSKIVDKAGWIINGPIIFPNGKIIKPFSDYSRYASG